MNTEAKRFKFNDQVVPKTFLYEIPLVSKASPAQMTVFFIIVMITLAVTKPLQGQLSILIISIISI
jgi:hypothetical protein